MEIVPLKVVGAKKQGRVGYFLSKILNTFNLRHNWISYYDKHLDEITVVEDCSYVEIYCGKRIALLQKNHVFGEKYAGFRIFGIRHFLLTNGIEIMGTPYVLSVLEKMVELCPEDEFPSNEMKIIYKILRKNNSKVFIPPISK